MGSFFGTNIGVDLGTANTLISVDGKGIVLNEPSVIAKDTDRDVVLAVGQSAKDMLGKAPAHIRVVKPLEEGVISDFDMAADMLATFFKQMMGQRGKIKARVAIGVPSGVTEVEKRAVEEVVTNLGPKEVYILEEPMAAAIGAGMDVDGTTGCMIVDIGGGTTDIAIITLGGVVSSNSIRYAGDKFNDAVMQFVRRKYSLLIGTKTAEKLKKEVGCAMADLDENGNDNVVFPLDQPSTEGNTGPNNIHHRYMTEDVPIGCKVYHDLGVAYGVKTPIIDSMITLAGAMHQKNFFEESRYNLAYLGIDGMSKEELLAYLNDGVYNR